MFSSMVDSHLRGEAQILILVLSSIPLVPEGPVGLMSYKKASCVPRGFGERTIKNVDEGSYVNQEALCWIC